MKLGPSRGLLHDCKTSIFAKVHFKLYLSHLEAEHLDIDEPERVVGGEEAADAEYELAGEVPQLRQEAVQQEGQGQAAHGHGHPCTHAALHAAGHVTHVSVTDGVDHGLDDLADALLHVETDIGEVCHVPGVDVAVVVGHEQLVQAVLVTPQHVDLGPAATHEISTFQRQ